MLQLHKVEDKEWICVAPKQPIFALLTFMILFLPSPHMMSLYTTKASASILNILWGFIFLIGGLLVIYFNDVDEGKDGDMTALLFCLAPLGVYSMVCGLANIGKIRSQKKSSLELLCTMKTLVYPVVFFLSPLIGLVIYLRAIFCHNLIVVNDYMECKYIECLAESSPQLCLQLYILLRTYFYKKYQPTVTLWVSIIVGIFSVGLPPTAKFLHHSGKEYNKFNKFKYYPIFFFNSVFRIFSWSIIFIYFYVLNGVVIVITQMGLLALINYLSMKAFFPELVEEKRDLRDYRFQLGEMAVQNFLSIPNLLETKAARFCRKFSFYASLIVNILLLLLILLLRELGQKSLRLCRIYRYIFRYICEEDNEQKHFYTEVVSVIISIGLFGLALDLIYARSSSAVFNIPVASTNTRANDFSKALHFKNNREDSMADYVSS